MDNKGYYKFYIIGFVLFLILIFLPFLLTRPGLIDFSSTGQIGDTIGGIISPFVAIIAAVLTFIAFYVQYQANKDQRRDIAKERIENEYFELIKIYSDLSSELSVHGFNGKAAFAELAGEWTYTYHFLLAIFEKRIVPDLHTFENKEDAQFIAELKDNAEKKCSFIMTLAYNLYYYGRRYMVLSFNNNCETNLGEKIKSIAFQYSTISLSKKTYTDYLYSRDHSVNVCNVDCAFPLFEGHSHELGHYYRHLFHTVKFVSNVDNKLLSENDKYEMVKILRAQFSDFEEVMLYYNSVNSIGMSWNIKIPNEVFPKNMGYIARYRLIKNFPPTYPMIGIAPFHFYKEEIEAWKKLGKRFFESDAHSIDRESASFIKLH